MFSSLAAGEQNGEHDQDRDRADINKHLHQADEFRAEQEVERSESDETPPPDKARRESVRQRGRGQRPGQRQNRDNDESAALLIQRNDKCAARNFFFVSSSRDRAEINQRDDARTTKASPRNPRA